MTEFHPETWKPVPGWPYEISDKGRVRRTTGGQGTRSGRDLSLCPNSRGYLNASMCRDGQKRQAYVHTLVAEAFLGARPDGLQVNHIDGNKLNNTATNLEYVTQLQNMRHAAHLGILARGESSGRAKLTTNDVIEIRRLCDQGMSRASIARQFGVAVQHVGRIARRRQWTHIT